MSLKNRSIVSHGDICIYFIFFFYNKKNIIEANKKVFTILNCFSFISVFYNFCKRMALYKCWVLNNNDCTWAMVFTPSIIIIIIILCQII